MSSIATVTLLLAILIGVSTPPSSAQTESPQAIGLQPSDVPGFTPIDPSVQNITDPNDEGFDQAFIQCAQNTLLLSEFDTGPDATESQLYGQGQSTFGNSTLTVGTAVFTDGNAADAYTAYSVLASSSFQNCWASTMDSLNNTQGTTTITPTTVKPLSTPQYGSGSTGFTMDSSFSVSDGDYRAELTESIVDSGSVVTMLLTTAFEATFPDSLRLSVLAAIAQRMGAAPATPTPTPTIASTSTTTSPPRPRPFPSPNEANCGPNVSVGTSVVQDGAYKNLPVAVATLDLPGDLYMNLAPSLDPGDFTFCSDGLTTAVLHPPPWGDPASSLSLVAGSDGQFGPFTYSSVLAGWTSLDQSTPRDQQFATKFDPGSLVPSIAPSLGVDLSKGKLNIDLEVAQVVLLSRQMTVNLLVGTGKALSVGLGPKLELDLYVSKQNLVDELAKDLKEGQGDQAAEDDVADQIATDDAEAVGVDGDGYYGLTSDQINQMVTKIYNEIDPDLIQAFNDWFAGLQAGSPDAQELENQDVTPDEVPADAEAALGGDTAGGVDLFGGKALACLVFGGGPEDPLADACAAL